MGDPVTIGLALGAASSVVAGGASIAQGQARADAAEARAEAEAQQREIQAENAQIAAAQEEAQRRRELNDTLDTIQAVRASRGLQSTSPTGQNLVRRNVRQGERNIATARFNRMQQASRARMAADAARTQGRITSSAARTGGFLRAGSSLLSAGQSLSTLSQSPPGAGSANRLSSTGGAGGGMGQPLPR
jgi:hypothetical protein